MSPTHTTTTTEHGVPTTTREVRTDTTHAGGPAPSSAGVSGAAMAMIAVAGVAILFLLVVLFGGLGDDDGGGGNDLGPDVNVELPSPGDVGNNGGGAGVESDAGTGQ